LRRILMWDEFEDFPMRKDYCEPDDYEWEPTPHDDVLEKAKVHYASRPELYGAEALRADLSANRDQRIGNERDGGNNRSNGAAAGDNGFPGRRRVAGGI